jgi:hypothetical protein
MRAAVLALLLAAIGAGRARAEPASEPAITGEALAHWKRGLAAHAAHRYQAASAEFAACYRLEPRRDCLFAWAQAARLGGDCAAASALYRRYLRADVSPRQAEAARSQLAACEAQLTDRAAADPASPPASPPVEPAPLAAVAAVRTPPPLASPAPVAPWYRDAWGDALAVSGVAAVAAGAVLYAVARRDAASSAPTYDAYAEQLGRARRTRDWAIVALGSGAALIAGGVVHMALATRPPRVEVAVGHAGLALRWAGAF